MPLLFVEGAMLSHPGNVRDSNEDAVAFRIAAPPDGLPATPDLIAPDLIAPTLIAIVADGMGGHAAGEVASRIAVDVVLPALAAPVAPIPSALAQCMADANHAIFTRGADDPACAGMGTTCTVLCLQDDHLFLAHIGDSRAYQYRDGALRQLSEDHSVVSELVRAGLMTAAEAKNSPDRNVILRALGLKSDAKPLIWDSGLPVQAQDSFVLCSDGLTDLVDDTTIAATIARLAPHAACQCLIDAAIAAGGFDNISVGVFTLRAHADNDADERTVRLAAKT